jgi:hypothetical protein
MVLPEIKAAQPPGDITSLLLDPDDMVGRTRSLVLWVVYDAEPQRVLGRDAAP